MTQRLTKEQLSKIIAEVDRLQTRREEELEPEQVKQILSELGLPPELLDEAYLQVFRRQTLETEQKRNRSILIGTIGAAIVLAIAGFFYFGQQNNAIAKVSAQSGRITLTQDDGGNLKAVSRQANPEVYYRVTLKDAPVGKTLDMSCDWIDPKGKVVKQNKYQTSDINKPIWDTHCRHTIGSAADVGNWKVQMSVANRKISDTEFEVK